MNSKAIDRFLAVSQTYLSCCEPSSGGADVNSGGEPLDALIELLRLRIELERQYPQVLQACNMNAANKRHGRPGAWLDNAGACISVNMERAR